MNKLLKIIGFTIGGILIMVLILISYVNMAYPKVGAAEPELKVVITPEKVARGKYLAYHVMMCIDCHSERDFSLFSGPPKPGVIGGGGEVFDQSMGFPGRFISPNITPHNLQDWTDGELFRLITTGVTKEGRAIFPVMPYPNFGKMDKEDIEAVIAFIRTLEPVENETEPSKADFPFSLILKTIPEDAQLTKKPAPDDKILHGKYLVNSAACMDCHTAFEAGSYVGEPLSGGRSFPFPDGSVVTSANLTPHETGLKNWSKEMFIGRFKMYADSANQHIKVGAGEFQTIMPWVMYSGMSEEDLGAIYDYLQTLNPVNNKVITYQPKAR